MIRHCRKLIPFLALTGMMLGLLSTDGPVHAAQSDVSTSLPGTQMGSDPAAFGGGTMRFEHLGATEGLSDSAVTAILQDRQGFLWFGTQEGLNKFDGYDFTIFKTDSHNPGALTDTYITSAVETPDGAIWLGTYYGGLNRFDRNTESFVPYLPDPDDPLTLPDKQVTALMVDSGGSLWVGTREGLSRYDHSRDGFLNYRHQSGHASGEPGALSSNNINTIYEDQSGRLWVGTQNGLSLFDRETGIFERYLVDLSAGISQVISIVDEGSGELWLGTRGGLIRFDPARKIYRIFRHSPRDTQSLSSNLINVLFLDRAGNLWVGFEDAGVNLVTEIQSDRIRVIQYTYQDHDRNSLSHNRVQAIFEDQSGILWFGTLGGGINKANPATRAFGYHQHEPGNPDSPAADQITALAFDPKTNALWIGTADSGLDRMALATGEFVHYRHDPQGNSSLDSDHIKLLYIGPQGRIYVLTEEGLQTYNRDSDGFSSFLIDKPNVTITAITHDSKGALWFGLSSGELIRVSPESGELLPVVLDTEDYAVALPDLIAALHIDETGTVWAATDSRGLARYDPQTGTITFYDNDGTLSGPSHNSITQVHQAQDGTLWLGTAGGGLNRFDPSTESFEYFTTQQGLPSNRVFGIVPDTAGYLWVSTGNGLARLDPASSIIRAYTIQDGLQGNTFSQNAQTQSEDGALFFGGVNGFNAFYPEMISDSQQIPPVVITAVSLFDQVLAKDISDCSAALSLSHDQNFLTFEFAALDYTNPEKNQYAYTLEGLNETYVNAGGRRYADYPNLGWGKYTFRLLGSNSDGVWNPDEACLAIEIKPPFWAAWWFIALVGLFLAFSVVIGYRWRVQSLERQRQRLAVQVFERTQEIERRRQMASGLSEVIRLLNTNQPLDRSLDFIVQQAVGLTSASKAAIFERQGDLVFVRACYPQGETHVLNLTDPISPSARCLLESTFLNRPLIYSRIEPKTMKSDLGWEMVSGAYRTLLCTPLLVEKAVYGGLALYYGEDRVFSPEEISFAHTLADQASLAITNDQLKGKAQDVAVTAERNRLARDLHDAVTQTLFSTSLIAEVLPKIWEKDPDQAVKRLDELRQLTRGALGEMRTLLMELRPSALREADPAELFKHLTDAFTGRTGVPVDLRIDSAEDRELPGEVKNVFYRIAQEGLNNILKHAEASHVWLHFECKDSVVILTISDNGLGFDRAEIPAGRLGMGIMAERAALIGADLTWVSQPGEGTTLRLVWNFDENTIK